MNAADLVGGLLAASPTGSTTVQTASPIAGSVNTSATTVDAGQNVAGTSHLTASLSGAGQGALNLVSLPATGSARANLVLHISGAPASQTFDVSIDGNVIGSVSTNAQGNGVLHINSSLNNADKLLGVLPTIGANASVSVGVSGQTPILTGALQTAANVNAGVSDVTSALTGTLPSATNLGNVVTSKLNSVVGNVDSQTHSVVDGLLATVGRLDNVANRLVGRVENLTAATVDELLGNSEVSGLLDEIQGLVPINVRSLI